MPAFLLDCSDRRGIRTSVATTNINQPFSGLHFFILNLPLPINVRPLSTHHSVDSVRDSQRTVTPNPYRPLPVISRVPCLNERRGQHAG